VSSGTGVIGLPVRLGVRPEIAVLRLKRKIS
jgi:predicted MPP superfamily phosphohydrolase